MSEETLPVTIDVRNLCKRYGALRAIDGVSFQIRQGEVVGFLGPNGAGKSTTMRILCGLLAATSGEAEICGYSVARHPEQVKARIGYMPEHNPLPLELRVAEYLRFRGQLKGLRGKRLKERVGAAMEICDLDKKARRRIIGTLSKGFRQRVGIADAILAEPEVVVMDEPTIGLDPHQIQGIRQLIDTLRGRMTVILSSHILPEIEVCSDRVIIINHGRVVAQGKPEELRAELLPEVETIIEYRGSPELAETVRQSLNGGIVLRDTQPVHDDLHRATYVMQVSDRRGVEDLAAAFLKQPGVRLSSLHQVEPSLENIFIAATRPAWKSTQDIGPKSEDPPTEIPKDPVDEPSPDSDPK
ncbi:MAG: ABC transporter ATP-binding protein [Verrucomicrobiota bacterium]